VKLLAKPKVQPLRDLRWSRTHKRRPPTLSATSIERKLTHNQRTEPGIGKAYVHLAVAIGEDSQTGKLARQPVHIGFPIVGGDRKEDQQAAIRQITYHLTCDADLRARDALDHSSHG
jgi:hypothetical protein